MQGHEDSCHQKMIDLIKSADLSKIKINKDIYPNWIENKEFHLSHRQALKYKKPEHYSKIWPEIEFKLDYIWPSEESNETK